METQNTNPGSTREKSKDWVGLITESLCAIGFMVIFIIMLTGLAVITISTLTNAVTGGPNTPTQAAHRHIQKNEAGILGLIKEAALEDPTAMQVLDGLPEQSMSVHCRTPENDFKARKAIGRASQVCQLSLYGETSQLQADYLVFMEYREHSIWEEISHRKEYPVRDAYLNANSLEAASPQAALRVAREKDPEHRALRLK